MARAEIMYRVPQPGPRWPAVAGPVERGVRLGITAHAGSLAWLSVDDEQSGTDVSSGSVRFSFVGDLVAHTWFQDELAAVLKLGFEFPVQAEQDVALGTPVIGFVASRVFDHTHSNISEVRSAPVGDSGDSFVLSAKNRHPVGGAKGYAFHLHDRYLKVAVGRRRFADTGFDRCGPRSVLCDA